MSTIAQWSVAQRHPKPATAAPTVRGPTARRRGQAGQAAVAGVRRGDIVVGVDGRHVVTATGALSMCS
jgi:S1-C subfamily serine protease